MSADFKRLGAEHEVREAAEGVTVISSARHGNRMLDHATIIPEARPDLRIVVFTRAGDASRGGGP